MLGAMDNIRERVLSWSQSLPKEVSVGSLFSRCSIAHKWKAPFRSILIRESSLWRMSDLGNSFVQLVDSGNILASRIILRSACETAALLAYLNKKTSDLMVRKITIDEFDNVTKVLLLGGKNDGDYFDPVNVITAVTHFAKESPELLEIYNRLSEDSHPNACGMIYAYSDSNPEEFETHFKPKIANSSATRNHTIASADLIFHCYEGQYNLFWPQRFEALEQWLRDNDGELESHRTGA